MKESNIFKVTLLGTSDVHGFYLPWDYAEDTPSTYGGLSRISTVYKSIKAENENTIIIDCGDMIQGNSAEKFLDREEFPGIKAMNKIGYEIYNMGNHEFNFGMERLINVVRQFNGISMMGNLYKKDSYRQMNGIYVKHFGPVKIGFISLNTPLVRHFEEKRGNLVNHDVVDAEVELKKLLDEIEVEEVDALIGIFHMGENNENNIPNTGIRDLVYNVRESYKIDAIFGGHMHKVIPNLMIKNTIYVQPGSRGVAINRIDLEFDLTKDDKLVGVKPSVIMIDSSIESDKEIEELLQPYHQELRDYANEHIGYIEGESLTPADKIKGIPQTRVSQTDLTDFFLEVMLHFSKADVVATHLDNPYPVMPGGEVKRKHIYNSYSYSGGDICNYKITGKDLKDYMEWSAGYFNQSKQGDISISINTERIAFKYSTFDIFGNVKYDIDITKPMGFRILRLRYMDDRPIKSDDNLTIGLNKYRMDFLTSDEGPLHDRTFEMVWSSMTDTSLGVRGTIRNLAMKYIQELPHETYVRKSIDRWRVIEYYMDPIIKQRAIELINKGVIMLPKGSDGRLDLSKSKNIYDQITESEYLSIIEKCGDCIKYVNKKMSVIDIIYLNEEHFNNA